MESNSFSKRFLIITILLFSALNIFPQKFDMELFKGMKMRSIGPAGMSGRVTAIDVVQKDPDLIYVGSASGGLWRSTSGGVTWEPIFDEQPAASIGALAIDQNVPDIIWVGTGEGNPRNSQTSGNGVYKSIDGGKTWKCLGLEKTRNIHRIIIDPTNSNTIYVGAQGTAWGESTERGVFKTTDGGKTWRKVLFVDSKTGIADLIIDPSNPNKLIAAMWEFRRWPWFFKSGGQGSGLFITFDGGETWQKKTDKDGLPKGDLGRIGLAIARSNTKIIYALVEAKKNALYRSDDGGFKWQMVTDENVSNRPFYYHEIYVDPENENRIYNLFSSVTMSEDGGKTFKPLITRDIHPDHHAWWINPKDGKYLIDGNDGGLAISLDRGKSWRFIGNLPLGQFYHVNVDMETPYNIYGGLQDNGSWRGPSRVLSRDEIRNSYWERIGSGDGFDAAADQLDPRFVYSMSQGGNLMRFDIISGDRKGIQPVHPQGKKLRFNWNAGFSLDPINKSVLYYGSQYLHKSINKGDNWEIISPDLTTNDPAKQKANESGGLTIDATNAENFTTIIAIAPSPVKEGIIWVGTDDGNVQVTNDGGKTWENVAKNIKGVPEGSWVPQIRASSYKAEEAFVVINNYRRDDWKPYVYQTADLGKTWNPVVKESDVAGYALTFIQDPVQKNLYFLGTEFGFYISIDAGKTWTKWTDGYPTVSTYDFAINPRENDLVIATFGRSIWVLDDITPLRELAKEGTALLDRKVKLFNVPDAYQYVLKSVPGIGFPGSAEFRGENLQSGAMITFYVLQDTSKGGDKIKLEIFDNSNKLVRTLSPKFEKGFNRVFWQFERKGVRMPGGGRGFMDASRLTENEEPAGPSVLPGEYKIKITYQKTADSANVKVFSDPRLNIKLENLTERDNMYKELVPKIEAVTKITERLNAADKTIAVIDEKMKDKTDKSFMELKKLSKSIKDSVKVLNELITSSRGQGLVNDENKLSVKLRRAYGAVTGYWDKPGESEKVSLMMFDSAYKTVMDRINNFFQKNWTEFRKSVEDVKISLFEN